MTIEEHYAVTAPKLTNWLAATGSSPEQARDLTQTAFLKLWSMREKLLDDDSAVSGLVFTIARNLRKNAIRDDRRLSFTDNLPADAVVMQPAPSPSDTDYLRARVTAAFARLPPLLREAYTLYQIAELSVSEIARETHASENLVKVRIHRAKLKLREILADLKV
jgi:RNA polymerase sigma-70 factor (ECF subfamily)